MFLVWMGWLQDRKAWYSKATQFKASGKQSWERVPERNVSGTISSTQGHTPTAHPDTPSGVLY